MKIEVNGKTLWMNWKQFQLELWWYDTIICWECTKEPCNKHKEQLKQIENMEENKLEQTNTNGVFLTGEALRQGYFDIVIGQTKDLRVNIDRLIQLYYKVGTWVTSSNGFRSDNLKMAHNDIESAKEWLGKLAGALGDINPYKANDGNRKTVADISDTADVAENVVLPQHLTNMIEKIDWLREETEKEIVLIQFYLPQGATREANIARTNAYSYLCEAKMKLGRELRVIKNR